VRGDLRSRKEYTKEGVQIERERGRVYLELGFDHGGDAGEEVVERLGELVLLGHGFAPNRLAKSTSSWFVTL
jgi:hypothetical protein